MKNLKIIVLFTFISVLICRPVDIESASNVSKNFFESRTGNVYNTSNIQTIVEDGETLLYIFILDPIGFIIVSGNDAAMPILGYSFENEFKEDGLPIQLDWMFDQYKNEIMELYANNSIASDEIRQKWNLYSSQFNHQVSRSVQPLLSCNWDQGSPWNDMCPEDSDGPGGNVLVGCVAVSMAQVMYYWGYPQVGSGDHGYNHWSYGYQYANFQDAFYDYDNMADNYGTDATALLLYHAGVSVNMGYGVDGSGAGVFGSNPSTYYAMRNYFLFKNTMAQVFPEDYSTSVYRAILQEDLDNNRPIIYVGYSNDGGHAWNIDGYDDDYFHCNWGWGGYQNGYFLLSSLNGFNSGQGAIINIEPQSLDVPNLMMTSNNLYELSGDGDGVINPGETVAIDITIENFVPWEDAQDIVLILEPDSNDLILDNEEVYVSGLNSGDSYSNESNPFVVGIPENNQIGSEMLRLHVNASGPNGQDFYDYFDISLNITLNQAGFPLDSDGTVKSSPLVIDLNNDSEMEIIYGDNNGVINIVDANGNSVFGEFPYNTGDQIWGAPASADIDLDGNIDFVVSSKDKKIYAFDRYGLKWIYDSDKYLIGTPAIGNVDDDLELEIVVPSYGPGTSGNAIFVVNHDGTDSANFPYYIDEKIKVATALADFDGNGKDDIVFGTDSDNLYLLLDSGIIENGFPFIAGDKIQSPPSILEVGNDKRIIFGSKDDKLYCVDSSGNEIFSFETDGNVYSSPSFVQDNGSIITFFGSDDGNVYGLDLNGNLAPGWPINIGNEVVGSVLFQDINGDSVLEVIAFSNSLISIHSIQGESFDINEISSDLQITSSSIIIDTDNDGDMEIVSGNGVGLLSVDIKQQSSGNEDALSMFRFNNQRNGYFNALEGSLLGDLNQDAILDILDIVQLINIVIGNQSPEPSQIWSGDLNSDGNFNVLDIVILSNLVLDR